MSAGVPLARMALLPTARRVRRVWRRAGSGTLEGAVKLAASLAPARGAVPSRPRSVFVLRNNDVGDLLVVTPLFEALRRRLPEAHIAAGVGAWNLDVLRGNPHLSQVLRIDAPWFNKYSPRRGAVSRWRYLAGSPQVRELAACGFEVGIDVLGSAWGALLLMRAGIPCRLGTRGYSGGEPAFTASVPFDPGLHVGRGALRFAELLGASELPSCRPQIFLTAAEREAAERWWATGERARRGPRLIVGPGGGLSEKRWPEASYAALLKALGDRGELDVLVLGGPGEDRLVASVAVASSSARACPAPPALREVFALVAACDLVACNSSMLMHVAAAFAKPTLVLLGDAFGSARQHQAQWGYPGLSRSLGREPGEHPGLATPEEAIAALNAELAVA